MPRWLLTVGAVSWRVVAFAAAIWFTVQLLSRISLVIVPLMLSLFLVALGARVTGWLKRRHLPDSLAALIPLVLTLVMAGAMIAFFVRGVAQQWDALTDAVARGVEELVRLMRAAPIDVDPPGDLWSGLGDRLRESSGEIAGGTVRAVSRVFEIGTQTVLTVVFAFFLLRDGPMIFQRLLEHVSPRWSDTVEATGTRAWSTLERYAVGVTLVGLVNTILTALALWVLGVPMVLPIALLTFVASYIPFVGPVVATAAGVFVALAERGLEVALMFLVAGVVIEILESNLTQPLIQGRVLHMHPIVVLVAVTLGTLVAGLAGTFLAVPTVAVSWVAVKTLRERRDGSRRPEEERDGDGEEPEGRPVDSG